MLIEQSKKNILNGKYTFIVLDKEQSKVLFTSEEKGIKDLVKLVKEHKDELEGAYIFDRVIGKAAAFLVAHAKFEYCFGATMSEKACDILEGNEIQYGFDLEVPAIMKNETEQCLMETLVEDVNGTSEAVNILVDFFKDKI